MIRDRQPLIQDWSLMKPLVTRADDKCVQKKGIRQPTINFLMKRYAWQKYNVTGNDVG